MTFRLSTNFHGVGIGPLSKILAVKDILIHKIKYVSTFNKPRNLAYFLGKTNRKIEKNTSISTKTKLQHVGLLV